MDNVSNIKNLISANANELMKKVDISKLVRDECERRKSKEYGVMNWIDSTCLAADIAYKESCRYTTELIQNIFAELLRQGILKLEE